jgi:hypothetical protein
MYFIPSSHAHAFVQRIVIGGAVFGVMLFQMTSSPRLGLKRMPARGKPGRAAFLGNVVEIGHRGPGALAAGLLHLGPIVARLVEIVAMRAELLVHRIALALQRLGIFLGRMPSRSAMRSSIVKISVGPAIQRSELWLVRYSGSWLTASRCRGARIRIDQRDKRRRTRRR